MYEELLEMRHFLVFHYPEEARLAPSWAAGVAGEGLGVKKRLQPSRLGVQRKLARTQNGNSGSVICCWRWFIIAIESFRGAIS